MNAISGGGKIWFPPKNPGPTNHDLIIPVTFEYGAPLLIGFTDTCYFTASNQHSFQPILPSGNFVANTEIGPYFAAPLDSSVMLTSYDESTHETYQYNVTIVAPPPTYDPS